MKSVEELDDVQLRNVIANYRRAGKVEEPYIWEPLLNSRAAKVLVWISTSRWGQYYERRMMGAF